MIILGDDMKRLIVLLTCLTLPVSVGALTKEERLAKLNELPIVEENGEKYLNTKTIRIPMLPTLRSLNLSNSVAIITYEILRQKNFEDLQEISTYFD